MNGNEKLTFKERYFEKKDSYKKILFIYIVLVSAFLVTIYPVFDIIKISLRPYSTLLSTDLSIIPSNATFDNYHDVLFERPFLAWMGNSFIISTLASLIGVVLSISAAYAFSRYKFIGRKLGMTSFLLTQIFPAPMLLLPTFVLLRKFNLIGNFYGILIPYVATSVPFSVWILKGFFDTVPGSIEESAIIDGANLFHILYKIMIPLSLPAIGVVLLTGFMGAWSEFVIARIILVNEEMWTLPVALTNMQGQFNTDWGIYSAASLITAIPVMVIFISFSKVLISGLTLGGVKG